MIIIIIIVLLVILALGIVLYKLAREEGQVIIEEKKAEAIEKEKNKTMAYWEKISTSSFEEVLSQVKNNSQELEILKYEIQQKLRESVKSGDSSTSRTCNEYLKKIDSIS